MGDALLLPAALTDAGASLMQQEIRGLKLDLAAYQEQLRTSEEARRALALDQDQELQRLEEFERGVTRLKAALHSAEGQAAAQAAEASQQKLVAEAKESEHANFCEQFVRASKQQTEKVCSEKQALCDEQIARAHSNTQKAVSEKQALCDEQIARAHFNTQKAGSEKQALCDEQIARAHFNTQKTCDELVSTIRTKHDVMQQEVAVVHGCIKELQHQVQEGEERASKQKLASDDDRRTIVESQGRAADARNVADLLKEKNTILQKENTALVDRITNLQMEVGRMRSTANQHDLDQHHKHVQQEVENVVATERAALHAALQQAAVTQQQLALQVSAQQALQHPVVSPPCDHYIDGARLLQQQEANLALKSELLARDTLVEKLTGQLQSLENELAERAQKAEVIETDFWAQIEQSKSKLSMMQAAVDDESDEREALRVLGEAEWAIERQAGETQIHDIKCQLVLCGQDRDCALEKCNEKCKALENQLSSCQSCRETEVRALHEAMDTKVQRTKTRYEEEICVMKTSLEDLNSALALAKLQAETSEAKSQHNAAVLEDKVISLEDKVISSEDKVISLQDRVMSFEAEQRRFDERDFEMKRERLHLADCLQSAENRAAASSEAASNAEVLMMQGDQDRRMQALLLETCKIEVCTQTDALTDSAHKPISVASANSGTITTLLAELHRLRDQLDMTREQLRQRELSEIKYSSQGAQAFQQSPLLAGRGADRLNLLGSCAAVNISSSMVDVAMNNSAEGALSLASDKAALERLKQHIRAVETSLKETTRRHTSTIERMDLDHQQNIEKITRQTDDEMYRLNQRLHTTTLLLEDADAAKKKLQVVNDRQEDEIRSLRSETCSQDVQLARLNRAAEAEVQKAETLRREAHKKRLSSGTDTRLSAGTPRLFKEEQERPQRQERPQPFQPRGYSQSHRLKMSPVAKTPAAALEEEVSALLAKEGRREMAMPVDVRTVQTLEQEAETSQLLLQHVAAENVLLAHIGPPFSRESDEELAVIPAD